MGNIFRNRRDLGALPTLSSLLAPSSSRFVPSTNEPGWQVVAGVAGTLLGATGMTQVVSTSQDDANIQITMPFNFPFFGTTRTVFVGSNSYLTFGAGSSNYSGLGCTNPGRALMMKAADNSYQRVYHKDNGDGSIRIRYEGNGATTGTPGSPGIIWEVTLYDDGKIMLVNGANNRATGVSSITNGVNDATCLTYTFAINQSFVFEPAAGGTTYNIYTGASVA